MGQRAQSADAFVSSIGVGTHFGYAHDPYESASASTLLQNSGIRYYRVGASSNWAMYNNFASHGVYANVVWDSRNFSGDPSRWNPTPEVLATNVRGVASFEGPNEKNLSCERNGSWVGLEQSFMQSLWNYSRSHASTLGIPILAPALGNCTTMQALLSDAQALGNLSGSSNVGNMHAYPGDSIPEGASLVDSQGGFPSYVDAARVLNPSGPLQISETGYGSDRVTSAAQAKYNLRLLLNAWNNGIARTYIFSLVDDQIDGPYFAHFGLIDGGYSPKPAYYAIKNLIATLSDPGANFTPGNLAYSLSGNTASVQTTLLQKQNGTFYLVVWVAQRAGAAAQSVQLNLGNAATVSAQTFDANSGGLTAAGLSKNGNVYSFSATDTPTILSIR